MSISDIYILLRGSVIRSQFLFSVLFTLCFPVIVFGGAPVHGAKAAGMGTAFVAVSDDPSAMAYNPAGLTLMKGTDIYGGGTAVIPSTSFTSPSGESEDTAFQIFPPPFLYAVSDAGLKDLRFGLAIYCPFGIGGRKWSTTGLTRYAATKDQIATVAANPTIAYQVLPSLSIGLGADYMYAKDEAQRMVNQASLGFGDGQFDLKGSGGGWGYNLGILFTPIEKVSVGFAYRSTIKVNFKGDVQLKNIAPSLQPLFGGSEFSSDMSTSMKFPDIISFGLAYRPTAKLTIALDLEEIKWSTFGSSTITLQNEVPQAGISSGSTELNWKNMWTAKIGAEYKATDRLSLRGGYAYVARAVPDNTLDPGNPDSTEHNFSLGFGYKKGGLVMDFFYMAGFFENRTVTNTILSGSYKNFVNYVGVGTGYSF